MDFIKIVPIDDENHLKVHSPILRDLIIRSCIQIEVFFKEWGKYLCSENPNYPLITKYNILDRKTEEPKGAKNWNFVDYFNIKESEIKERSIYFRPLNKEILPFELWKIKKELPEWWNVYNSIKHNGINSKKEANLKNALDAISALFLLHCVNGYSKSFLRQFSDTTFRKELGYVDIKFNQITSPLDTKRYLFKDTYSSFSRPIKLVTKKLFDLRNDRKRL